MTTNADDVFSRCKRIFVEHLNVDDFRVISTASIIEDLAADSLDLVELVMAAEEEFGIEVSDDEAEKWVTVQDAVDSITKILAVDPSAPAEVPAAVTKFITGVLRDVGELGDRTSPDDYPGHMLVTPQELESILLDRLKVAGLDQIADEALAKDVPDGK